MTFIDPTSSGAGAATAAAAPTATAGGLNQLDNSQTFLKLLVAQLKNQNPDNPTDPTAFMSEIAQLTAVQSQMTLNADEETVAADSMIGRQVSGTGAGGAMISGTVTGVLLTTAGKPQLELGSKGTLDLSAVSSVYAAATTGTTTGTTATAAPGTTTTSTSTPTTTTTTPTA